jgi:tetratricopeptide (TPR) repeat protein
LAEQKRDDALAVYRHMIELFPKDPQPPTLIGITLLSQRQQREARAAFEKSLEISADYLPAVERLVDLDIADQQYATAIDRVQKRIDQDPTQAVLWAIRGKIYLAQRDFIRAEADVLKSIELNPKVEPNYLLLAQLYVASNRPELAIAKLTAFTKDDKDVPALMQLGTIHESLNHYAEARDAYEKVLACDINYVILATPPGFRPIHIAATIAPTSAPSRIAIRGALRRSCAVISKRCGTGSSEPRPRRLNANPSPGAVPGHA